MAFVALSRRWAKSSTSFSSPTAQSSSGTSAHHCCLMWPSSERKRRAGVPRVFMSSRKKLYSKGASTRGVRPVAARVSGASSTVRHTCCAQATVMRPAMSSTSCIPAAARASTRRRRATRAASAVEVSMRMSSGAHPAATAAAARRSSASVLPERAGPTILAVRPSKAAISAIMSVMGAS